MDYSVEQIEGYNREIMRVCGKWFSREEDPYDFGFNAATGMYELTNGTEMIFTLKPGENIGVRMKTVIGMWEDGKDQD